MSKLIGYIDFDGVLLDTEKELFKEYHELKNKGIDITRERYLIEKDWEIWLKQANIIGDSLEILKENFEKDFSILTTIHSFNEGKAKIDYLRKNGVKDNVILVPYICKKHEVVDPKGNVLVDDYGGNLIGWQASGGVAIRFSNSSQKKYDDFSVVSNLNMAFEIIEQLRID